MLSDHGDAKDEDDDEDDEADDEAGERTKSRSVRMEAIQGQ